MRGTLSGRQILLDDQNRFVGISFGFGFCAEHESGIKPLREAFGLAAEMTRDCCGADFRKIHVVPRELTLVTTKRYAYLVCSPRYSQTDLGQLTSAQLNQLMDIYNPGNDLRTAWSELDFAIRLGGGEAAYLKELYQAFHEHDILIGQGPSQPFGGSGLVICIKSRLGDDVLQEMVAIDLDYLDLQDAAAATGIAERLKAAGRRYYALSPQWADEQKKTVKFWLNPMEQSKYEAGWYSVPDLDEWIAGRGPVVKK